MKYEYYDNRDGNLIFTVIATSIIEADKKLKEEMNIDAIKSPYIGCQIKKENE